MSLLYRRELDRSVGCAVGWDSNLHPSDSCQLMPGNLTGPTPSHSHCRLKRVQRGHVTAGWVTADRFFKNSDVTLLPVPLKMLLDSELFMKPGFLFTPNPDILTHTHTQVLHKFHTGFCHYELFLSILSNHK